MAASDIDKTLEEIRKAQADIAGEMDNTQLNTEEQRGLERASLNLRNLERSLVKSIENELLESLKKEVSTLSVVIAEMKKSSEKLFKVTEILDHVVKITGQLIDILAMVK